MEWLVVKGQKHVNFKNYETMVNFGDCLVESFNKAEYAKDKETDYYKVKRIADGRTMMYDPFVGYMIKKERSKTMTNKETYMKEINVVSDYKISTKDFMDYLAKDDNEKVFFAQIERIKKGLLDLYDVAVDWSIPVIMVKKFLAS